MSRILHVLLVDDEYLAIEDISSMIDWPETGFEIVATARSGKQALKVLSEKPVDLVVTDISMPGMDGITLIEEAKKFYPGLVFLLLTAYAEIDYMKRAFRQGVADYLIKDEITSEILAEKLKKIRDKMLSHDEEAYSHLQKLFRKYFNTGAETLPASLLPYKGKRYHYCIVAPDILYPWTDSIIFDNPVTAPSMIQSALPYIEDFHFEGIRQLCSFIAFNNKIVILAELSMRISMNQIMEALMQYGSCLLHLLTETLPYSYSFFYRHIAMTINEIHLDYFKMQAPLRGRYFLKGRQIMSMEDSSLYITNTKIDYKEDTLLQKYRESPALLATYIQEQLTAVTASHNYTGLSAFLQICFSFLDWVSNRGISAYTYENCKDLPTLSAFLIDQLSTLPKEKKDALSYETRQAIAYIAEHCKNPELSLQEIAGHIGLSVTHFSRIFKAETGETAGNYITSYRMEKACRLLKETNQKIYEISEETGYSSPQYFSQVFFKQMGMKPLDYRKGNRN